MPNEAEGSVLTGNPEAAAESWATGLDDYNEVIEAKGWQSNADVLKSYVNLERQVGADKVVLPSEGTDLAEWEGWQKLGTPESAEDYQLAAPEGFENYDQGLSDWFREAAHSARMPAEQAQRLHDAFVERMIGNSQDQVAAVQQQQDGWESDLKKEYGTAFDERVAAARSALREFGTPELQEIIDGSGLGSHPEVVKAFAKIGMALGKGPQGKGLGEESGQFGTTPEMAKEQIAKIRSNPALQDKTHPEHAVLNAKLTQLYELAYGNELVANAR